MTVKSGEDNPNAKLDWEKVAKIREERSQNGTTYEEIGRMFGIHKSTAMRVCRNLIWIEEPYW